MCGCAVACISKTVYAFSQPLFIIHPKEFVLLYSHLSLRWRYSRQGDTVSTMINTPFHLAIPYGGDARVNKWSVLRWRTIDKRLTGGRHDVIGAWGNEWSILLLGGSARRGSDWGAGTEGVNWTRGVWNGAVCGQGNFVLLTQQERRKTLVLSARISNLNSRLTSHLSTDGLSCPGSSLIWDLCRLGLDLVP